MFQLGTVHGTTKEMIKAAGHYDMVTKRDYDHEAKKVKFIKYINFPVAFDIEASSFTSENGDKLACMYIWQMGINGHVITGRTWAEWAKVLKEIKDYYKLSDTKRIVIYVHNLPYDSEFFRKFFNWSSIFARDLRKPLYMVADGFEFRDSLALAGCTLENVGKDLTKYKVRKMVGDLNYDLVRTPKTPLTDKEFEYCTHDVYVLMAYIQEQIEIFGDIAKIPMTKTGIVRQYCRDYCKSKKYRKVYRGLMEKLTITGAEEYGFLKSAFAGGFTHANYRRARKVWHNVKSYDFTSSYPAVLLSELFPMSQGQKVEIRDRKHYEQLLDEGYGIVFDVKFTGVISKTEADNYLSESKCNEVKRGIIDNGRIKYAQSLWTTITNVDFDTIEKCYDIEEISFGDGYIYQMAPLPKPIIECILHFYKGKTELKDVVGEEVNYQLLKGMLNSIYGCMVQDIINEDIEYNGEYYRGEGESVEDQIYRYNTSKKRFLFYPWGVFCTAYARKNLWSGILECGKDYIYADTDSIKILNPENHQEYIKQYNEKVTAKITAILEHYEIDPSEASPKTIKGKSKPIGVWDDDGDYVSFKTLGAKRYLVEYVPSSEEVEKINASSEDEKADNVKAKYYQEHGTLLKSTIAGSNKDKTSKWFMTKEDPWGIFDDDMIVPEKYSGRLVAHYAKAPFKGVEVADYLGNKCKVSELSYIHFEKSCYSLSISQDYDDLLHTVETFL